MTARKCEGRLRLRVLPLNHTCGPQACFGRFGRLGVKARVRKIPIYNNGDFGHLMSGLAFEVAP